MKEVKNFDEFTFVHELVNKISQTYPAYRVYLEKRFGNLTPDITIDRPNGTVIIEVKNAKHYSTLPFSTLRQLENYRNSIPDSKIFLISFSKINELMKQKLRELQIESFINPDFETIIKRLRD